MGHLNKRKPFNKEPVHGVSLLVNLVSFWCIICQITSKSVQIFSPWSSIHHRGVQENIICNCFSIFHTRIWKNVDAIMIIMKYEEALVQMTFLYIFLFSFINVCHSQYVEVEVQTHFYIFVLIWEVLQVFVFQEILCRHSREFSLQNCCCFGRPRKHWITWDHLSFSVMRSNWNYFHFLSYINIPRVWTLHDLPAFFVLFKCQGE